MVYNKSSNIHASASILIQEKPYFLLLLFIVFHNTLSQFAPIVHLLSKRPYLIRLPSSFYIPHAIQSYALA